MRLCNAAWSAFAVALSGFAIAGSHVALARAEAPLQPDPSPAGAGAATGLRPDSVGPARVGVGRMPAAPPARATQAPKPRPVRIETVPLPSKVHVQETPRTSVVLPSQVGVQVTPRATVVLPAAHTTAPQEQVVAPTKPVTAAPKHSHAAPIASLQTLLHPAAPLAFPARSAFAIGETPVVDADAVPALGTAPSERSSVLPAALAFLALSTASASFLFLAYRLRREADEG